MIVGPDFANLADKIAGICLFLAVIVIIGMIVSAWKRRH